jgi:hypothetical protein
MRTPGIFSRAPADDQSGQSHRPRSATGSRTVIDGFSRGTVAVALGYLLAFSLADANGLVRSSWVVGATVVCGALAAGAGLRALPGNLRLLLAVTSSGGFTMLGAVGFPVTAGLLIAAVMMCGQSMLMFEARHQPSSSDIAAH